jgi:hypothetical protein
MDLAAVLIENGTHEPAERCLQNTYQEHFPDKDMGKH